MGNVSPEMMEQAMHQMKNMSAQDWDNMTEQMKHVDPTMLPNMASNASSQFEAQQQYMYKVIHNSWLSCSAITSGFLSL